MFNKSKRRRRSVAAVAAAAVGVLMAITGCSGAGGSQEGHVTVALGEEPRTLASWNAYGSNGHTVLRNIQEALLNRDPVTNELVPELALSWEQVEPTVWRFELRQGVEFTDGTPFNAETAADGINYVLSPENSFAMRTFLGPDVTASASGEYTLDLTTESADPILPDRMYFVTIPSYPAIEADEAAYETNPVGTGPYVLDSWNRGQSIDVSANEDWWGRDAEDANGSNESVTSATYVFRPETEVRAGLVETGEGDVARWVTQEQCDAAANCVFGPGIETIHLRLDTPNPLLGDERIREAISLAIDRDELLNGILGGGEVSAQLVGPAATGFNEGLTYPEPDLEAAKALVAEAAADGVDLSTPIQVVSREGYILRANEAVQLIATTLTSIGLTNVTSGLFESAGFEEQWTDGFDAIPEDRGWIAMGMHGNELLDYSSSFGSFFTCESVLAGICDPELDEAYAAATPLVDEERQQALADLAQLAYDTYYDLPIGQPNFYYTLSDRVEWEPRVDGFLLLQEMTLSEPAA